ncbi:Na+/H+ antiporter subunit E [Colwellia psychrerythraea]|uniref:Monovalent cation/proton antiporter, MnhE/PhaE family subunit n=1 Tax=Colwellia psychrerythraea (strain 34H / ATCC BAA-681) TaxID=167879 RepID=Q47XJ2_COLP3|nr:Na+/H+ antiporter subunit E [Colwellia psychrerythraea]AAZ26632.1 monovalent cation/proton antiporter, MnhE/PhaE family subunit [Colwellia psychrerythraea 34H]
MRLDTRFKWLPAPILSILLFLVWLLLNNSVSAGHIVLAVILAIVIPLATSPFRTKQPLIIKPGLAIRHLLLVLYDIVTANVQVAILILGPTKKLTPGFIKVPLDLTHSMPITILASTVSLTPGTVSAEVLPWTETFIEGQDSEQRFLLIHVLDLKDEQALINTIKQRYEAPLMEIFQC